MPARVVITGLGAITPLGLNVEDFWHGLVAGRLGIGPITRFDTSKFPVKVAGEVRGFEPTNYMPIKRADRIAACTQYAIAAAKMAARSARLDLEKENRQRVGVVIATSGGMILLADQGEVLKNRGPMRIDPLLLSKVAPSMVSTQVGLELGAKGPNSTINSACASGSDALGQALNLLRLGHADVIIAGGAEQQVTPMSIAITGILGALSREPDPAKACRPFDLNRKGMVFGDGAGLLVLETLEHARARGAEILAELAGAGWSFDAFSETAPDAEQQAAAMASALRDAVVAPAEVDYINAHGTGTKLNDAAETRAIKMVFGERAYRVSVSSNKSMLGHLACAAGSIEAVASVLTIQNGLLPPTINYETPDPECDLDYVPNHARPQAVSVCLSNSFGMGGQNCCIVIRKFSGG
ncbi:MAG: beta-ketoacyl-[acyl-carrier-protein] synthase II [Dehalococcoidia bacterium]|jgi:3-oxoacyl-[acyl-carrier-protein] synthase II|nr:MAG: beta-ketoacyl-[acyl-carrier-protein] synthase II [Dehalococcoidia bacterium]